MFSTQDVRDILQSLPLEENSKLDASGLSPLLVSSQGDGFVTTEYARREFERIVIDAGKLRSTPLTYPTQWLTKFRSEAFSNRCSPGNRN